MSATDVFGLNVRKYRTKLGLSQEELAECLGVASQTVNRWENGHFFPNFYKLEDLADALGVSVCALFALPANAA